MICPAGERAASSPRLIKTRTQRPGMTSLTRELVGAGAILAQDATL
jgi:hypothetical protein